MKIGPHTGMSLLPWAGVMASPWITAATCAAGNVPPFFTESEVRLVVGIFSAEAAVRARVGDLVTVNASRELPISAAVRFGLGRSTSPNSMDSKQGANIAPSFTTLVSEL